MAAMASLGLSTTMANVMANICSKVKGMGPKGHDHPGRYRHDGDGQADKRPPTAFAGSPRCASSLIPHASLLPLEGVHRKGSTRPRARALLFQRLTGHHAQ